MEEQKTEDYKERLQKARQRRNGKDPMHWFMIGGCAVIVVLALVIIVKLAQGGTFGGSGNARVASASEAEAQETVIGETLPEDEEQAKEDEEKLFFASANSFKRSKPANRPAVNSIAAY